jgi:hypothetical protein
MAEKLLYNRNKSLAAEIKDTQLAMGARLFTSMVPEYFKARNPNYEDLYKFKNLLETLDGIEFGAITFDNNKMYGASFIFNDENIKKINNAGYALKVFFVV